MERGFEEKRERERGWGIALYRVLLYFSSYKWETGIWAENFDEDSDMMKTT